MRSIAVSHKFRWEMNDKAQRTGGKLRLDTRGCGMHGVLVPFSRCNKYLDAHRRSGGDWDCTGRDSSICHARVASGYGTEPNPALEAQQEFKNGNRQSGGTGLRIGLQGCVHQCKRNDIPAKQGHSTRSWVLTDTEYVLTARLYCKYLCTEYVHSHHSQWAQ